MHHEHARGVADSQRDIRGTRLPLGLMALFQLRGNEGRNRLIGQWMVCRRMATESCKMEAQLDGVFFFFFMLASNMPDEQKIESMW